jgi:hypothetical protein
VELFHALIRSAVNSFAKEEKIVEPAHVMSFARQGFDDFFEAFMLQHKSDGCRKAEMFDCVIVAAEWIVGQVEKIVQQKGESQWSGSGFLTSLFGVVPAQLMPMAYSTKRPPSMKHRCDLPASEVRYFLLLGTFRVRL